MGARVTVGAVLLAVGAGTLLTCDEAKDTLPVSLPPEGALESAFQEEFSGSAWFERLEGIETYEDSLTLRTDISLEEGKDAEVLETMCRAIDSYLSREGYPESIIYFQGKTAEDYGHCDRATPAS